MILFYVVFNVKGNRFIGDYVKYYFIFNFENIIYDVKWFIGWKWDDFMV